MDKRQETSDAIPPRASTGSHEPTSGEEGANEPLPVISGLRVRVTANTQGSKGARSDALKSLAKFWEEGRIATLIGRDSGGRRSRPHAVGGREREVSAVPDGLARRKEAVSGC